MELGDPIVVNAHATPRRRAGSLHSSPIEVTSVVFDSSSAVEDVFSPDLTVLRDVPWPDDGL